MLFARWLRDETLNIFQDHWIDGRWLELWVIFFAFFLNLFAKGLKFFFYLLKNSFYRLTEATQKHRIYHDSNVRSYSTPIMAAISWHFTSWMTTSRRTSKKKSQNVIYPMCCLWRWNITILIVTRTITTDNRHSITCHKISRPSHTSIRPRRKWHRKLPQF